MENNGDVNDNALMIMMMNVTSDVKMEKEKLKTMNVINVQVEDNRHDAIEGVCSIFVQTCC